MEHLEELKTIEKLKWLRDNGKVKNIDELNWIEKQADKNINNPKLKRKAEIILKEIEFDLKDEKDTEEFFMPPVFDNEKDKCTINSNNPDTIYSYQDYEKEEPKPIYQKSFKGLGKGIKRFSKFATENIKHRSQNIDKEKLKERVDSTVRVLGSFSEVALKVLSAIYKLPTKRHFKKLVSYEIDDITQKYKGNGMIEECNNILNHRFYVDYLPKLIVIAGGLMLFNTSATVLGLFFMWIGLIYYLVTVLAFTYEDNALLNHIADLQDKQGIRMKDAYYTNVLVLYRYFLEYQRALGVTIDMSKQFKTEWDDDFGTLLYFTIKEDKQKVITSLSDHLITYYKAIPFIDPYQKKLKMQQNRVSVVMLDQILLYEINKGENISELFATKEEYLNYFVELKERAELKKQQALIEKEKELENKVVKKLKAQGFDDRSVNIIRYLRKDSEVLGMSPHNLFKNGIKGNKDYLKVRMSLNQGTTLAQAKAKVSYIGSKTGFTPKIKEIQSTDSAINLIFYLNRSLKSRRMTMKDIEEEAKQGLFTVGKGYLGDYTVKIPREDSPFFALVGGLSRSGKSTLATRLLVNTTYLQDENGNYDYEHYFVSSVKDEDYTANGFKQSGMFVTGSPFETYTMLKLIDRTATERKQVFLNNDVINIKQYNNKFPNRKMGKIMLVMDEYANLFKACGNKKIEINGGKVKLKDAIEQLFVKINAEHGSRGVNSIVITQNFMKDEVGLVRDTIEAKILGNAQGNVWSSYDPSGQINKMLQSKSDEVQGVFLINSKAFRPVRGVEYDETAGFVETKTHFIDTPDIRAGFNRTYNTEKQFGNVIREESEEGDTAVVSTVDVDIEGMGIEEESNDILDIYDI